MCCPCHCRGCCLLSCFLIRFSPEPMMLPLEHLIRSFAFYSKTRHSPQHALGHICDCHCHCHWYCSCSNRKPEVLPCASVNLQHLCLFGLYQPSTELWSSTQPSAIIRAKIQSQLGAKFAAFESGIGSG